MGGRGHGCTGAWRVPLRTMMQGPSRLQTAGWMRGEAKRGGAQSTRAIVCAKPKQPRPTRRRPRTPTGPCQGAKPTRNRQDPPRGKPRDQCAQGTDRAGQATTQDDNARDPAPHGPPRAPAPRPSRRPEVPPYRQPERARAQKGGGGPHLTPPAHRWPPTNTRSRGWEQGMTRCTYRAVAHQLMESRAPADQPRQNQDPTATRMHRMSTVSHQ